MTTSKRRLGKGLDALLPNLTSHETEPVKNVPIDQVRPNRFQPRTNFDTEKLEELAGSIRLHGILQPLLVRVEQNDRYELVAGERRLRAAKMAGLSEVPVVVRDFDDAQMHEVALIENLQREDLNPIEEALAYKALMEQVKLTQEELAGRLGKSRSAIANTLRLLQLDREIQNMVKSGLLSEGHARVLVSLPAVQQRRLGKMIADQGMTVRHAEKLVQKQQRGMDQLDADKASPLQRRDPYVVDVELKLARTLGAPVRIQHHRKKGVIEIDYYGVDDLQRLLELLSAATDD